MKARYLLACLTVAIIGCSDNSNDTPASESDLMASQTETGLECELQVLCGDRDTVEVGKTELACAVLESKAQDYKDDKCLVQFLKEQRMITRGSNPRRQP